MVIRFEGITVDAFNPRALAEFWAAVLGWKIGGELEEIEVWIQPGTSDSVSIGFPEILFLINANTKQVKNRLHLDLRPDNQAAEVARLEKLAKFDPKIQPELVKVAKALQKDPRKAVSMKAKKVLSGI